MYYVAQLHNTIIITLKSNTNKLTIAKLIQPIQLLQPYKTNTTNTTITPYKTNTTNTTITTHIKLIQQLIYICNEYAYFTYFGIIENKKSKLLSLLVIHIGKVK